MRVPMPLKDSQLLTFEEDDPPEPLELAVKQVVSVVKSAQEKVVSCNVVGDSVKFVVTVSHTSPAAAEGQSYSVKLSPLHLQLQLYVKDKGEDIKVEWFLINTNETNFEIQPTVQEGQTAGTSAISETLRDVLKSLFSSVSPSVVLSTRPTDIKEVQNVQNISLLPQGTSPPKPPRAHELRLLVKNIAVNLTDHSAAGSTNLACIVQLNDPMQKFSSSVAKNAANPFWKEEFIFELSAKSKALQLQIVEDGKLDSPLSAKVTVPLDLFRKQPSGQQSFALNSSTSESSPEPGPGLGSISAEFSFIEASELKTWQVSSPVPATKIEKDRTVMPCGTVVTTVTAVKTKPRLEGRSSPLSTDSPVKTPVKVKVIEKDFSVQAIHSHGAPVSKTLSSSDTELLVLNGTDPVAEAAIRQLSESAKQKLKSPRKKSTIIISGVSKDSEAALMMDYAAAMDSSCKEVDPPAVEEAVAKVTSDEKLSLGASETVPDTDPQQSAHKAWGLENGSQQWDTNTLLDQTCEEISGSSLSVSETGSMKKSKGGILKKSAKLFFRRRHHQKDPGMSQSHNDLVYLQQPLSEETRKKGGTLSRILSRKLLSKNKSKNKLNGASAEPYV
ncbi:PREDICTED: C2 domain-containing protein 2 isoform X3 [Haliaeetus leucocephalus]|uniref:C2 domain-containing protein 2 isoform X3 n=1 Tax=Haliaeetus leucocephalus TaxID=52644 RepID=UPI000522DAAB|nr:PREDICTED: C2 domain-containing protein 2 isoform X3 [Haliaeetus albicilla]XP_010578604.1 PREDICTED: C2 domain-containing protein 2 isoform X3 [Haliaeetus leucocephalus]